MHPAVYVSFVSINICVWLGYHFLNLDTAYRLTGKTETDAIEAPVLAFKNKSTVNVQALPTKVPDEEKISIASTAAIEQTPAGGAVARTTKSDMPVKNKTSRKVAKTSRPSKSQSRKGGNYLVPPPPPMVPVFDHGLIPAPPAFPDAYSFDTKKTYQYQSTGQSQRRTNPHYRQDRQSAPAHFVTIDKYNRVVVSR